MVNVTKVATSEIKHIKNNICYKTHRSLQTKDKKKLFRQTVYTPSSGTDVILLNDLREVFAGGQKYLVSFQQKKTLE